MKPIAIIPARGGSKRLHNKNLTEVCGVPMLNWTIWAARDAGVPAYVSTDDLDIALVAKQAGAAVIGRPAELATDTATTESVIEHALTQVFAAWDTLVLLQPTSPLRCAGELENALAALDNDSWDSVLSVTPDPGAFFVWGVDNKEPARQLYSTRPRTQDIAHLARENGAIYATKRGAWETSKQRVSGRVFAYQMEQWQSVDVDTLDDLEVARFWMMRQLLRRNSWFAKAMRWQTQTSSTMPPPR